MNERIRELSYEAQKYALNKITGPDLAGINELWQEKFAELIVRECAYIAKNNVMNISTYRDAKFVEHQIREHFGVEQ